MVLVRPQVVTISEELLQQLRGVAGQLQEEEGSFASLFGSVADEGDVVRVESFRWCDRGSGASEDGADALVGVCLGKKQWEAEHHRCTEVLQPATSGAATGIAGILDREGELLLFPSLEAAAKGDRKESPRLSVIRIRSDLHARLKGILESDILANKAVTVIGLGSGGSVGALELAKCGVGQFRLVDFDRLETHNVARHACSLSDVGRLKTRAVRDAIRARNPDARVSVYEIDVLAQPALLEEAVDGVDLVFVATDSEQSKLLVNRTCLRRGVPAVYGAAYERALGGDIIRVIPGQSPCYECAWRELSEFFDFPTKPGPVDYSGLPEASKLRPEPGLGIDVGFIALIHAKVALLTLLRGTDSALGDFETDMVLWGNRSEWLFEDEEPLCRIFVKMERRPDCVACGGGEAVLDALGLSEDEARAQAAKIVQLAEEVSDGEE